MIPATVSRNESGQWIEGNTYTVTAIASASLYLNGVFYNSGITSINLPSSITSIGSSAFFNCGNSTEVIIDSQYAYTNATSATACGYLLQYATTVKVLTSLVETGTNS